MTQNIEKTCSKCQIKFIEDRSKWPKIMQLVGSNPPKPLCVECMHKGFKDFLNKTMENLNDPTKKNS